MSAEENKAVIRRAAQAASSRDFDAFDELMAPDVAAQYKEGIAEFRRAFPDFRSTIEDQIAEGDKVVTRWTMRGTHREEFRGIAPTGGRITVTGMGIFRFSDEGKVVESWDNFDQLGMMRQLGAIS